MSEEFEIEASKANRFKAAVEKLRRDTGFDYMWLTDSQQIKKHDINEIESKIKGLLKDYDKDGDGELNDLEYYAFARRVEAKYGNDSTSSILAGGFSPIVISLAYMYDADGRFKGFPDKGFRFSEKHVEKIVSFLRENDSSSLEIDGKVSFKEIVNQIAGIKPTEVVSNQKEEQSTELKK